MVSKGLHPATLPTLCLVSLLATFNVPQPILDQFLELSLTCIYEDHFPRSLKAWLQRLALVEPSQQSNKAACEIEDTIGILIKGGLDALHGWLNDLKALCPWSDEDESSIAATPLHRTSPLALYLRRFRMTFGKLAFDEAVLWWDNVQQWCLGAWVEPDHRTQRRVVADAYSKSKVSQDYQAAKDALSFYDLDDATASHGKPQYALLNTAFLEFEHGGWKAAREALAEAVQVARNVGDPRCLAASSSLYKRLEAVAPLASTSGAHVKSPNDLVLGDGRPSPTDLLWEVRHASGSGRPVPALFSTMYSSRTLHQSPPSNTNAKEKGRATLWNDAGWEPAWHIVAANLWSDLGSSTLAELREDMALEIIDGDRNLWDVRLAALTRRTQKLARSNRAEEALQLLLRAVDTRAKRRTLGVLELRVWERSLWNSVRVHAERRGQHEIVDRVVRISPPPALHWSSASKRAGSSDDSSAKGVANLLNEGRKLLDDGQGVLALPRFLRALRSSSINSYEALQLRAICHVVDCRLAVSPTPGEAARGLLELERVWGDVLACGDNDKELLAIACETRGRALALDAVGDEDAALIQSVPFLRQAQEIYASLSMSASSQRTLVFLARLFDHLSTSSVPPLLGKPSWIEQRDSLAGQHLAERDKRDEPAWDVQQVKEVADGVQKAVATRVASEG